MCQISVLNLRDPILNRRAFLLMGSMGAVIHKDGWGIANQDGTFWKCSLSMCYTSDSGKVLKTKTKDGILLGHIRQASPKVPVKVANSHPFEKNGIVFVHNGKLTPKDEKQFVMEEEEDEIDTKTGEVIKDKNGNPKKKIVSRSDSLIFFEKFMEFWQKDVKGGAEIVKEFPKVLRKTMELFTGKFAFVFIIQGIFFVVRGRTADLYITYAKESYSSTKILGWAVNTSKEVLDVSSMLLSNLNQMDKKNAITFTYPVILDSETIFVAREDGLEKLGEIKEETTPTYTAWKGGAENFTSKGNGKITTTNMDAPTCEKYYKDVFEFMRSCSLSIIDIQNIFIEFYQASLLEATEVMLKDFTTKVIPMFMKRTNKDIRKAMRRANSSFAIGLFRYTSDMQYPWILNSKENQLAFVKKIEEEISNI